MKIWMKKLQNPFALVAQGFLFGGLLFFATHAGSIDARASGAPAPPASVSR